MRRAVKPTDASGTLSPLPPELHRGLTAVSVLAFLSLITTTVLFAHLSFRFITWKHRAHARINQYVALLLNLILADLQQAIGFSLNVEWVRNNSITASTPTCWTQGWFLNAGDVGSAIFTFAMAIHLFADIVFDWRLGDTPFLVTIISLWTFNYFLATIGIIMHPGDFYMRAGPWCWINEKYMDQRIWFHYLWILAVEFGTVLIYSLMFIVLWRRIRGFFYADSDVSQLRAESAARSVIFYPIVYVVCTLPAVVGRLRLVAGDKVGFTEFTVIGVMMCSNGWLDVLLYTITRKSLIFGPAMPNGDVHALETFSTWNRTRGRADHRCRTVTTIEAGAGPTTDVESPEIVHLKSDSLERLFSRGRRIKAETVVHIESTPNTEGEEFVERVNSNADAQSFGSFERQVHLDLNDIESPQKIRMEDDNEESDVLQ